LVRASIDGFHRPRAERVPAGTEFTGRVRHYFRHSRPWEHATLIVNNADLAAPFIIDPGVFSPDQAS
jgi:hypothetical protein